MRSRTIQIAAAAVLLVGILLLTRHLTGTNETQPMQPPSANVAREGSDPIQPTSPRLLIEQELETARKLFARQDIAALVQLLATGQDATKIQVAEYLGRIGDSSTLPALQPLAEQWQGPPGDNPFLKAITAIRERQAQSQTLTAASTQEPNNPPVPKPEVPKPAVSPENAQTGVAGTVVDKLTQKPVQGAIVQYLLDNPSTATVTDEAGQFVLTGLQPSTHCFIHFMAKGYVSQRIIPRVVKDQVTPDLLIELDRGSRVQGTVTDPSGKPIAGATAKTFFFTNHPAVTDRDGRFEIDGLNPVVDRYSLHVTHPDYPAVSADFSPGAVGETVYQNVILKPGADVFGQVTDPNGKPVAGVWVGNTSSASMWNCVRAKTDSEGLYRLDNVDIGDFILWAAHPRYGLHVERTTIEAGTTERRMDIRLQTPVPLHGKVVDDANEPVAGVTVVVHEYDGVSNLANERYTTDANGLFAITNAPAQGGITLNPFGGGISGDLQKFELGQPEYIVKVHRAGRIYGKVVTDATGEPVPEFLVKMTFSSRGGFSGSYSATWNREGYNFKSPEGLFDTGEEKLPVGGSYKMTVWAQGFDPLTLDPVPVLPIADDPNRTVFRLQSASLLAGEVVDDRGNPVKDAVIAVFSKAERYEPIHWRQFTTDAAGIFIITGVGNEQEFLYVTAPGFVPHSGHKTELETEDGTPARIVLSVGGRIFGSVLDEKGRPWAGARIRVNKNAEPNDPYPIPEREARTDTNGNYELSGLPTGRLWVALESESRQSRSSRSVTLSSGESLQVDFNEAGFALTGIVRSGSTPVKGALISISRPQGDSQSAETDSEGRFRVTGVPAGQCEVIITRIGSDDARGRTGPLTERRSIQVQSDMELNIDFGAGSISGPIPELLRSHKSLRIDVCQQVESFASPGQGWTSVQRMPRIDDRNERFECGNLSAGRYYLVLEDAQRVLGITDVLTLGESERKQNVEFRLGRGQLSVRVTDARTGRGVGGAQFLVVNDLGRTFIDRRFTPDRFAEGMPTDPQGKALYQELPPGQYQVCAWARGYLPSAGGFVTIRGTETQQATVALQPAAMAAFELSRSLRKRVDTDSVIIACGVTDLRTQSLVPWAIGTYTSDEHTVAVSLQSPNTDPLSLLHLPEGKYRIDYVLCPFDTVKRFAAQPVHKGTVTVELTTGQTESILLED